MKYSAKVNDTLIFNIEAEQGLKKINDAQPLHYETVHSGRKMIVHHNNKAYTAEVVELNVQEKKCILKINNQRYEVQLQDEYDQLLKDLGLEGLNAAKMSDLKSPMPGLVLKHFVHAGDVVEKGDSLLVLEAMKMENIIKAPAAGKVKQVLVKPQDKVEKNQVLIQFE